MTLYRPHALPILGDIEDILSECRQILQRENCASISFMMVLWGLAVMPRHNPLFEESVETLMICLRCTLGWAGEEK